MADHIVALVQQLFLVKTTDFEEIRIVISDLPFEVSRRDDLYITPIGLFDTGDGEIDFHNSVLLTKLPEIFGISGRPFGYERVRSGCFMYVHGAGLQ